jgi:hypothetical protein
MKFVPNMSGVASQPAEEFRRSIKKELNSNNYVMYICVRFI